MNFLRSLFKFRERRQTTKTEKVASDAEEQQQMQDVRRRLEIVAQDLTLLDRRKANRIIPS